MRVGILGPLTVTIEGRSVDVTGARLRTLLVRLACEPGRFVSVERLAAALWPGTTPTDPANAVQSLVSRLRKTLDGHPALVSGAGGYRLDVPPGDVDAHRFERLAAEGRRALRDGDPARAATLLAEALDLWRGPPDVDDALAARWQELRLAATEDHAEAVGPRAPGLVARLRELTAAHPLRERLAAQLITALHADGRRAEALAAFEECRHHLAEELGVDPSPQLRQAHLLALTDRPGGNLRTPLTSFVGRDDDVERLAAQILDRRLVTLVGPGGAGKTRLATTVAARDPHTAWLVELAPVAEAADVPSAVLRALDTGGQLDPPQRFRRGDVTGRLAELLAPADALLVLDNCEHVVEAAAKLSEDLLGRCPKLRILATSREPLGILGETLFPVGPLPPGPAVRLLRDRAEAVRPGFEVTPAAEEICRRLDGLPLAIELAAARLRSFTAEQLAARLDDRFRLLTGGSRTALPRHRTLHAVVAWSWDLLEEPERDFGAAVAVFPGTFDAGAAAAVAGVRDAEPLLDMLVDRSLLQVVPGGTVRYRMLETIREFALEELIRAGRAAPVRSAHAAHFLALVEHAEPHLRTAAQVDWLARLRPERANLHAAVTHACDTGDAATAFRLGAACAWFWTFEDNHAEAAGLLGRILDVPGDVPAHVRTVVLAVYIINSGFAGDFQFAEGLLDGCLALAAQVPPGTGHPFVGLIEPVVMMFRDDSTNGATAIRRRLTEPLEPWSRGMLLSILGHLRENDGDMDGMLAAQESAAVEFRRVGERWGLSMTLASIADARARRGDFTAAAALFAESIELHHQLGVRTSEAYQRIRLAAIRRHIDGPAVARAELQRFAGDPASLPRDISHAMLELGQLARHDGDLDEAERCYVEAWRRQAESPLVAPQYRAIVLVGRAQLDLRRGDLPGAAARLAEALGLAVPVRDMPVVAQIAVGAAALAAGPRAGDRGRDPRCGPRPRRRRRPVQRGPARPVRGAARAARRRPLRRRRAPRRGDGPRRGDVARLRPCAGRHARRAARRPPGCPVTTGRS
ncbi:winged helix-turn-helix domain-containing protein [Dactylosporangium sp. NBC_01737]|uniref:BTAD domain-containing putative transcriptional regulator n=1 Tax=Dactylosporangium sp. NBC_01737 TaxID=2975959 RepID=UPI002E1529A3|nr:winged helix-turn-helix domain-containing protein [Dactylosporangium sp. NBC_01737]